MTAVGATNVGSVRVKCDPTLQTNSRKWELGTFYQHIWKEEVKVKKGDYFGEFNLGSTIVLIFEAPNNFQFNFTQGGQPVRMGTAIEEISKYVSTSGSEVKPISTEEKEPNMM